jgi:hypothetical protein
MHPKKRGNDLFAFMIYKGTEFHYGKKLFTQKKGLD